MARALPDETHAPAAPGRRLRGILLLVVVIFVAVDILIFTQLAMRAPPTRLWFVWLIPFLAPAIVFSIWYGARIHAYRIVGDELVVVRAWLTRRFPLAAYTGIEADPEALGFSIKVMGNDGLGAISGTFANKKLGRYKAYVTDPKNCVVLRGTGVPLVLSPAHPGPFIAAVRRRLG
jgi:hypothetical protein